MNAMVTVLMGRTEDEAKLRFRLRLFTAISFLLALLVGAAFSALFLQVMTAEEKREADTVAANYGAAVEERLGRSLSSTYALAAVLRQGNGSIRNFESLATEMLNVYGGISSLQLAKDGVISQVVPYVGNAKALGHNLLQDAKRNKDAMRAVETRELTLAGPVDLIQGGTGVIGRLPIFLSDAKGKEYFWGFTTALIRISDLLASARLSQLRRAGYDYELSRIDPDSGKLTTFARSSPEPLQDPLVRTIEVPNGQWFLHVAPADGWVDTHHVVSGALITVLVAFLVALFTHATFKQPLLLRREVADKTRDLAESNRSLNEEIAERKHAQQAVIQTNRLYSVLSHTNAAIVRIGDRLALLDEICHVAVERGGFPLARIAMLDERTGVWRWVAQSGEGVDLYNCDANVHDYFSNGSGAADSAVLRICSTGSSHPAGAPMCPVCPEALAAGFESHIFLRLRVHGRVTGLLSIYAREHNFFDTAQLRLLEEMTEDVSFALENIEREAMRKKAEENLRKLSRAVEQSANAVVITDSKGVIEYVNPWFTRITGYAADEVIGKTPSILKSGETHPETYKRLWDTILSGKEWAGELHNRKKNGDLYWCLEVISPLKDESGRITHFVAVTEDISERKQSEQTIRHLAFHDPLTGLPNRRLFNDRLHQAAATRKNLERGFGLMLLDLDRFKTVNDTLGHDVGDALLKAVGARLQGAVRSGDTLARMGGDEFALIVQDIAVPEEMAHLAEKLIAVMKDPYRLYGHEIYVTTSIGVTLYPADATDAEALIKNADIALYRAKDLGRNNYQFFTGDMNAAMMQRLRLESAMRWAIERGEFMLLYQPQADVVTGRIRGTEALIRWRHPELGMVSPAQFIPVAEETGMIVQIGEWVLRTACAQAKEWQRAGLPMRVAVNLSARQFHQGALAETITGLLREFDLPPELLEVELTEGILMEDTSQTAATLNKLHAMGVQISIDDFGTGYSSLAYLKRLPIQVLKIDQSFVRDIHVDADDRAIVTAVIALAHSMKLKVVAEGVETEEQLSFLRAHRCDIMQGYFFSRPVPGSEVQALMMSEHLHQV